MGLHIDDTNVSAFDTVERFTGPRTLMEDYVAARYAASPNWRWSDASETSVERMHPTTYLLGFYAMMTGIPEITAKNFGEVFVRIQMIEMAYGTTLAITHAEVKAHIGLRANVREKTKAQFDRTISDALREKAQGLCNRLNSRESA